MPEPGRLRQQVPGDLSLFGGWRRAYFCLISMSSASSITITPKQYGDIQRLLQDLESHIVARGAALMRDRAVRSLKWSAEDNTVTAQVQGGKLYKTQLEFDESG
eukprot:gene8021-9902_t